jgi:hypothetical protein
LHPDRIPGGCMFNLNNPPQFDPQVYTKLALNDLVVYSMHFLNTQGIALTSEDVISACFTLFPKRFSLVKYPYWPDSAVVSRRWSECRSKGYLVGNVATGFKLTPKGFRFAVKVEKALGGIKPASNHILPSEVKTRAGKFVRAMETSDAYRDYKKHGKNSKFNEFDFRSLLLCTMESPADTLKRNLDQFREYADINDRKDLLAFLEFCEHKFTHLLIASRRSPVKKIQKSRGKK